jgi:hypothetical protein
LVIIKIQHKEESKETEDNYDYDHSYLVNINFDELFRSNKINKDTIKIIKETSFKNESFTEFAYDKISNRTFLFETSRKIYILNKNFQKIKIVSNMNNPYPAINIINSSLYYIIIYSNSNIQLLDKTTFNLKTIYESKLKDVFVANRNEFYLDNKLGGVLCFKNEENKYCRYKTEQDNSFKSLGKVN